jgi:hypothetical protein
VKEGAVSPAGTAAVTLKPSADGESTTDESEATQEGRTPERSCEPGGSGVATKFPLVPATILLSVGNLSLPFLLDLKASRLLRRQPL